MAVFDPANFAQTIENCVDVVPLLSKYLSTLSTSGDKRLLTKLKRVQLGVKDVDKRYEALLQEQMRAASRC